MKYFFLSTRKLSSIEPLPCATELANQKAAQRKLAQERQNGSAAAATSIAPRQRPQPGAQKTTKMQSNEPSEVISKGKIFFGIFCLNQDTMKPNRENVI